MGRYTSWIITVVVTVAVVGGIIWYSSLPGKYDEFATCIKNSGAKFFGAFWCSHCQDQKALFGKSAKKLPYVECSTLDGRSQVEDCKNVNIESYPTWEFSQGERQTGVLSLAKLSDITSCPVYN